MIKCSDCEQKVKPNKFKGIKIGVELEGYEKIKEQLRNIEATFDRILEKQERIGAIGTSTKDHVLLQRIDNDCGRIVRMIRGYDHKDMDKIAAKYDDDLSNISAATLITILMNSTTNDKL